MGRKRAAGNQDIGAAFTKQRSAAPAALSLEVSKRRDVVPENLLASAEANFSKVYKLHDERAATAAEQADKPQATMTTRRSAAAEAEDEQEDQEEEEDALQGNRSALINKWEATAASIVSSLGRYAGGCFALPAAAQAWLVHIVLNQHLHDDPLLSIEAARLLRRDLERHPPAELADGELPRLAQRSTA